MSYLLLMLLSFLGLDTEKTEVKVIDEHTFVVEDEKYYVELAAEDGFKGVIIKQERFACFFHS